MLRTKLCTPTLSRFIKSDHKSSLLNSIWSCSCSHSSIQLGFTPKRSRNSFKSIVISCTASRRSSGGGSLNAGDPDDDDDGGVEYYEASVLISETIRHYRLLRLGFHEGVSWQSSDHLSPSSAQFKKPGADVSSLGHGFLRRFQSPTIFLKISCEGDFLLPIIVGELAIEKLIDALQEDDNGDCPNQFQFVRNLVGNLGYKVKMVRITERVVNTYFSRIYLNQLGEKDVVHVDLRPSDAINVAIRCKAPIYVKKQIFLTDTIRIAYGTGRVRGMKSVYDVSLDSAADGPDFLSEELDLVQHMNLAVEEERYNDAALLKQRLLKLRNSKHEL